MGAALLGRAPPSSPQHSTILLLGKQHWETYNTVVLYLQE